MAVKSVMETKQLKARLERVGFSIGNGDLKEIVFIGDDRLSGDIRYPISRGATKPQAFLSP